MLFIRDSQGQVPVIYPLLDHGVGADQDLNGPALKVRLDLPFLGRPGGPHQKTHLNVVGTQELPHGLIVLTGQHFRRRHHDSLVAGQDRSVHSGNRHDRLAGTDIALDQPVHGSPAGQVLPNVVQRFFLGSGQRKGQGLYKGSDPLIHRDDILVERFLFLLLYHLQGTEKAKKFIKYDPFSCLAKGFRSCGEMDLPQGLVFLRKPVVIPDGLRQVFLPFVQGKGSLLRLLQSPVGKPGCQRINRLQSLHLFPVFFQSINLRLFDHQAAFLKDRCPCKDILLPLHQIFLQVGHIEPPKKQGPGLICHQAGAKFNPSGSPKMYRGGYFRFHGASLAAGRLVHAHRFRISDIAARIMVEQLIHSLNIHSFQQFFCFFTDPLDLSDRCHNCASFLFVFFPFIFFR